MASSLDKYSKVGNDRSVGARMEGRPEIMTPDQAAGYLQVNKETIYRYIRQGKLVVSKLGRSYRIPRRSLDLLLWTTRTRKDITLRDYTGEEIAEFIRADTLDEEALQVAKRFLQATEQQARERRQRPSRQTKPA